MSFDVAADSYDRFMGRYAARLATPFLDFAGALPGQTALDVGCGPGALTVELVSLLGPGAVTAVDPSEPFVEAARIRHPDVDVRLASAEELPFPDDRFDAALAQLVVPFMSDPVGGLTEVARVTRVGGVVAASVWDTTGERAPFSVFWRAARELNPGVVDESEEAGGRRGHLGELFGSAGLTDVEETDLAVSVGWESFDAWWDPYTLGVGPAGVYARTLTAAALETLRDACRSQLPEPPFTVTAHAWAARGRRA